MAVKRASSLSFGLKMSTKFNNSGGTGESTPPASKMTKTPAVFAALKLITRITQQVYFSLLIRTVYFILESKIKYKKSFCLYCSSSKSGTSQSSQKSKHLQSTTEIKIKTSFNTNTQKSIVIYKDIFSDKPNTSALSLKNPSLQFPCHIQLQIKHIILQPVCTCCGAKFQTQSSFLLYLYYSVKIQLRV